MELLAVVAIASLVAPVCLLGGRGLRERAGYVGAVAPLTALALLLSLAPRVLAGEAPRVALPWAPELGLVLSLRLDGLSLLFGLLISGIGVLVMLSTRPLMEEDPGRAPRLCATLLLFMTAMTGLVLADNVLTLFVFWEATSVASYLLVGFDHTREKARKAALQALLVTALGGLALLGGLLLLARAGGSFELSVLASRPLHEAAGVVPALALILVGCFTKSAQFPFHYWLPGAMEAPASVSAYLHSSTMVKAGVYLLARLHPALGEHEVWRVALPVAGGLTIAVSTILALRQTALKPLLAYSTVASLGTLVLMLGVGTPGALTAAMAFLLAHALYKASLFLGAGAVMHATHIKDAEELSGLRRLFPALFAGVLLSGLAMAGIAPMLGFVAKEYLLEAALDASGLPALPPEVVTGLLALGGACSVFVALMVAWKPFAGAPAHAAADDAGAAHAHHAADAHADHGPHSARLHALWLLAPLLLGTLGLLWGLMPGLGARQLVDAARDAISPSSRDLPAPKLALWHGLTPALMISLLAIGVGAGLYALRAPLRGAINRAGGVLDRAGPHAIHAGTQATLLTFADRLTRTLQTGRLRVDVAIVMTTVALALWLTAARASVPALERFPAGQEAACAFLCALMVVGAALTALAHSRLAAIAGLGLVGTSLSVLFAVFGAPDLAMTQISVDVLTIVLLLSVFRRTSDLRRRSGPLTLSRDAVIALASGGALGFLTLLAAGADVSTPPLSSALSVIATPEAFGRNVVNVILVDFRALDTLGEITVIAGAALGVGALMTRRQQDVGRPVDSNTGTPAPAPTSFATIILNAATRGLMPLIILSSLVVMLQGHNKPGGGFIGGLMLASGVTLHALTFGTRAARALLRVSPVTLLAVGLLTSLASGLFDSRAGFLEPRWVSVPLPDGFDLKLGTPLLFDVGVFLVVIGGATHIVLTLLDRERDATREEAA